MDQTLDQVIKTRKIKFNGRNMKQQGQKQQGQFRGTGGPGFTRNLGQRRQNFVQFRPRGQFVQRRQQQFGRMNFGGIQKRNQGQFMMMMPRRNFPQQRRQFGGGGQFVQTGFVPQQFRRNVQQMQMFQPRRFQQRNFGQVRFQQNRPMVGMRQNQQMPGMRPMQNMRQNQPTKLYISNLDFGVTNQDVKELFSEFGPMVRYGVNHSAAGRSVGSAEVFFKNKISAVKAIQKYNGVTLDGRPMKLEIAGGSAVMQPQQMQPRMQRRMQPMQNMMMNKNMVKFVPNNKAVSTAAKQIVAQAALKRAKKVLGVQNKPGMGGRLMNKKMTMKKKVAPNAEQLDADLEAYAASKD